MTVSSSSHLIAEQLFQKDRAVAGREVPELLKTVRIIDELRPTLSNLMGIAGYSSILSRTLALTRKTHPLLTNVSAGTLGKLEFAHGSEEAAAFEREFSEQKTGIAFIAQMIELLMTFIGKPLTMNLLKETWPEVSLDLVDDSAEVKGR